MDDEEQTGSWRELGAHWRVAAVLAGGVLAGAVTIYVAGSLLPTAVGELGGARLYAWNTTAYLLAQVVATMLVRRVLARTGTVRAYLAGFGVFAAGSVLCAVGPSMGVLLAGRAVQGAGAGLLTGLGFAVLYAALPPRLWARGSALISAMFGVGNFAGPALGGLCAQFGSWRTAFVVLAVLAVALAALVPAALRADTAGTSGTEEGAPLPVRSLASVVAAVGVLSVAGVLAAPAAAAGLLAVGVLLAGGFVLAERRAVAPVLPRATYTASGPLRWVYLTIGCLAAAVAVETFLPLFGQRLGGLPPAVAGFVGAALSFGWSAGQLLAASAHRRRVLLVRTGPAVLAAGLLVLAVLQRQDAPGVLTLGWLLALLVGGVGIGMAVPHLSVAAMAADPDAAAGIATVLTMATAFGAALAGLLANLGAPGTVTSARWLLAGFAVLAALGVLTARRATLSPRPVPARPR